ncbi:MAG: HEAT repeat domain-containing protein [Deltaproteobacteria bacterium]|nr:HEAT repeat domain-containing protein [Deltaproteobacteria bacterium]
MQKSFKAGTLLSMFLAGMLIGGCAAARKGESQLQQKEDPVHVAARELYRRARAELYRSRSNPEALESSAALAMAALKLEPGYTDVYVALAEARASAGNREGSIEALKQALASRPGDPELTANLQMARHGLFPGKTIVPKNSPPKWLSLLKVELKILDNRYSYDDPVMAEVSITNLSSNDVAFDPIGGVDPAVDLTILVSRKADRYDEYGAPQVTFRSLKGLKAKETVSRKVDLNQGAVAVAFAAYAPHYSRILAFRAGLMGKRGQPWDVDSKTVITNYKGVAERESVFSDLEDQLFSSDLAERLHLIKLYGHLVANEKLPAVFAPRLNPLDYDMDRATGNLLKLLHDKEPLVRAAAVRAVSFLKNRAGNGLVQTVKELLTDKQSWLVRGEAVYATARLLGEKSIGLLKTVEKEDPEEAVKRLAGAAIIQVESSIKTNDDE